MLGGMTQNEPGGRSPRPRHDVRPVADPCEPRITGISQVTAFVPHLLGYQPDHSLVLLTVRPEGVSGKGVVRGTLGFTLRMDLPDLEHLDELPGSLSRALRSGVGADRAGGAGTVVHAIVYDLPEVGPGRPSPPYLVGLTDALEELCDEVGVMLHDLVLVRRASWPAPMHEYLHLLRAGEELDVPWAPLPAAAEVPAVADMVLLGRSPLASREEVVRAVRQRDEKASARTSFAVDFLAIDPARLDQDLALASLGSWVVDGSPAPGARDRAWIAVLLHDKSLRDGVLARWVPDMFDLDDVLPPVEAASVREHVPAWPQDDSLAPVERLLALAGQVPLDLAAPLLTLAGFTAWAHGEGTMAVEAGRYALEVDPDYRMAQLLDHALATGMRPPAVDDRRGAERAVGRGVA